MSGGNQKCSICNKVKSLSQFGKFKGFRKSICYDCEKRKAEKKPTEVKKLVLTKNQHIAPSMKDVTIQHIQNMPKDSLSETEISHKIKIMFGDKVEYCPFCETWKEIDKFAPPEPTSLFVSRSICKDCKAKQSKKEEAFTLLQKKPIVEIPEIKEIKKMPMKVCAKCENILDIQDFYKPKDTQCKECYREAARNYHLKKKADKEALKEVNKTCSVCGENKPYSEFYSRKIKNGSIYYHPECKECAKEAARKNLAKKRVKKVETKFCTKCQKEKARSEFHKNASKFDGLQSFCKDCNRAEVARNQKKATVGTKKGKSKPKCYFNETEKYCPGCSRILPNEKFSKDRKAPSGLYLYCKECEKTKKFKICKECGKEKPYSEFFTIKTANKQTRYSKECKACLTPEALVAPVTPKENTQICGICNKELPLIEFYSVVKGDLSVKYTKECKACLASIVVKFAEEDKPFVEKKEPAERKCRIPRKKVLKRVVTRIETYLL